MKEKSFTCRQCGACCRWGGSVLLTDADIRSLAQALALTEEAFIARHTQLAQNRRQLTLTEQSPGVCIFLHNQRCAVYAARPQQCRDYPHRWQPENREGCAGWETEKIRTSGAE